MVILRRDPRLALALLAFVLVLPCTPLRAVSSREPEQVSGPLAGLPPDHEAWSRHLEDAKRAVDSHSLDEAQAAALQVFTESLRFSESDRRLRDTHDALEQVIQALVADGGPGRPAPLLREMASRAADLGAPLHPVAIFARTRLVQFLVAGGKRDEAEAAAEALHTETAQALGPDHVQSVRALNGLAAVVALRDNRRALEILEAAVERARSTLGPTSPEVVALLHTMGRVQLEETHFAEAERSWTAALEGAKTAAPLAPQVAQIECELGRLALARDQLDRAGEHLDRCRSIYEASFGEKNPAIVPALLALSSVQRLRGNLPAAFQYADRARRVAEGLLGANDPLVARSLLMLATILIDVGQEAGAAGLVDRAGRIVEQQPISDTTMLSLLGNAEERMGRFDHAIERFEKVRRLVEERWNERSLSAAAALNDLAYALAGAGRGERAVSLARRASKIVEVRLGSENSLYASTRDTLGVALSASGEPGEGIRHIDEAIALVRRLYGDRSAVLLELNAHRASALRALGRIEESEQLSQSVALDRRERGTQLGEASDTAAPLLFAEKNFRLSVPGSPWVVVPPETVEEDADVVVMRRDPVVWFSVAAYTPGEHGPDLGEWLRINEEQLRSGEGRVDIVSREPLTIAGIPGQRIRASIARPSGAEHHDLWYGIHNGFYYVIKGAAVALHSSPEALWDNTEKLRAGFELIDPARHTAGSERGVVLRSERFGYSIDLADLPWVRDSGKGGAGHAELGASRKGATVVAMPVSQLRLEIDDETLARAMIASMGFEEPASFERLDEDGLEGLEYRFERERNYGAQKYRVRILRRGDVACLVSAAGQANLPDLEDALAVVERFRWEGEPRVSGANSFDEAERARHRLLFDHLAGKYFMANQHTIAIEVMKLRLELSPEDAEFREQLARYEIALGRYKDAIQTIEPVIAESPERPAPWVIQAQAKHQLEGAKPAIPSYQRAFELGYQDEAALAKFVDALWEADRKDEAFETLNASIGRTGSRALRVKRASLHRQQGRLDEAKAELEELEAAAPGDVNLLVELALVHLESARYRQAIEACDRLLQQVPRSWEALYLKAQAQIGAGLMGDAKSTIERAAELRPDSKEISELRALVTTAMGRGSTEGARDPVAVVSTPGALIAGIPPGPPEGAAAFGAYCAFWTEAVHFQRGASFRRTTQFRATILSALGLEQFSNLRFDFHPSGERIFVNHLTVYDVAGKVVAEGEPSEQYVTDAVGTPEASSAKVLNVPLPGLSIGGSVELSVTREEIQPPERFTYSDFILAQMIPVHRSVVYVEALTGDLAEHATGAVQRRSGEGWVAWVAENPKPFRWEPLESQGLEHLPRVRIGEARDSWEGLAREYLADIQDRLSPAEPIPALAAEASAAALESPERMRSLAEVVQGTLRHETIAFGPRARIPKAIEQTLRDRYGDCKDHSLLLFQLLRQAGYQASLALVKAFGTVDPQVPSLDQFDHMVVHCADCPGVAFIDATDKHVALGKSPPRGLGGRLALILDPEDPRLEEIPNADPSEFAVRIDRRASLSDEWALGVREEVVFEGHVAASMRSTLRSVDRVSWEELLKRHVLGDLKKVVVSAIEIENVDQLNAPLRLSIEYEVENAFTRTSDGVLGSLPAGWERAFLSVAQVDGRMSSFEIPEPLQISETVRLTVPSGHVARIVGSGDREFASPFLEWTARGKSLPDGLAIQFAASRTRGTFPADQYQAYFDDATQLIGFLDQPIEIRRSALE